MLKKRIIPCLDIMGGRVVKGVNFVDLKNIGDPVEIAKLYEAQGADEIVLLDITATIEKRDANYRLFEQIAKQVKIPVVVGGGMRSIDDMRKILASGVDKVSVNSAFVANPELIDAARARFGKSRIVAAIDGKKTGGGFNVFVRGGRDDTGLDLIQWAKECEMRGVGEILLTSMDCDGVQDGYDIEMTRAVTDSVNIPVIASGGCGKVGHIIDVFKETGCAAALVASLLHYGKASVADIKREMKRSGVPCAK
ncbi:MAG: imidazole glycerol phosphate synthase subunit HisF [Clostridiales bacterium]|nr:imidazole glycerol phosphate synthase subunit HisF [Clostridiales bacterium]